jgi:CheY-like chemotaxis protein/anti-sigma regulatory factor (Ser/Thr protein kinase)
LEGGSRMAKTDDGGERANVAQDRMLATLSHEIRTPLNGVIGMAGLLATTRLDETQAAYLGTLRACGEHLLNLVNDVLDLAKLDAGRVELEPSETDVEGLLQGVAELLSPTAHAGGVEIAWWVGPDVPVLLTDDGRLRQILFNLAGNAVKFAAAGGVTLSAGVVARHPAGVRVRFDVADTGPGLEADAQAMVFGEFVQTEAGVRAGGAGLGLAIVKRLADAFGGRVGVESEPGAGAVFWFEADFVAVDQPAANPSLAGLTVGVVSPSPIVRAAAARPIEACGGRPVCAETAKALTERTQIVLIDGAAARVRPCKGVPSLILLAPEARRRIGPARAAGFAGYLIKPLRRQSVADRIRAVLGEAPAPSPYATFEDERAGASEKSSGARVLLVEDNPVNALLAKALLTREGCLVDRAATGEEALQAAAQVPYDLILMDLRMPDMDGLAAARALRARGVRVPIVALTANGFQEDRRACLAAGMDDFLTKPLSPHALVTALQRWTTPRPPTEAAA